MVYDLMLGASLVALCVSTLTFCVFVAFAGGGG